MQRKFSGNEVTNVYKRQIFSISEKVRSGETTLEEIGDLLPGSVLITDLVTSSNTYMNRRGYSMLNCTLDEILEMGPSYYQRFFVADEVAALMPLCGQMHALQDNGYSFQFTQRVRAKGEKDHKWYFGATKLIYTPGEAVSNKMMIIVNEVNSLSTIAHKVNSILDESEWLKRNFSKFCLLTKREKEIITLLMAGNTSSQISEFLNISTFTVNTHRRNIGDKLECKSFADLYKFASAFGLLS